MLLHDLKPSVGSRRKSMRKGRGNGSKGTYAGRGCKGQNARSGGGVRPGFEGGQTPLYKRLPKLKGFKNRFRVECQPVNIQSLSVFAAGAEITPVELKEKGLISSINKPVKLLSTGETSHAYTLRVHKVSSVAKEKIEKAGGKIEIL
ncbi:50S ribosomal protein L15 [Candidatus Peregrinibacteria bacterium]|nr:MAG: 50S ribosomal protein L15 [Candidatus Peregrinibacteria bacterium]